VIVHIGAVLLFPGAHLCRAVGVTRLLGLILNENQVKSVITRLIPKKTQGEGKEMKRAILSTAALALVVTAMLSVTGFASMAYPAFATGNGAPSGHHFNLNIIGVPNQKNANFDGGEGARIFVSRTGQTQFYVHGGDSYQVLDHDGTDGKVGTSVTDPGIVFPYDAAIVNQTWQVQIWVRLLGPTGSEVKWNASYYDALGDAYVLWSEFKLTKGTKFQLKTGDLLANGYQDMLWNLDPVNNFRICQMRIYLLD